MWLTYLLLTLIGGVVSDNDVIQLSIGDFYGGVLSGSFDAIVDVRSQGEWDDGHIPNATFVDFMQFAMGEASDSPDELKGCTDCRIAVYCHSGVRARQAAQLLISVGFKGPIYNGMGVKQWTEAGYELVDGESADAPCACELCPSSQCRRSNLDLAEKDETGEASNVLVGAQLSSVGERSNVKTSALRQNKSDHARVVRPLFIGFFLMAGLLVVKFTASSRSWNRATYEYESLWLRSRRE